MLKGLEKLNGFYILPTTPIEMVYDANLNLLGYCLLLERKNYPYVMYCKLNLDFDIEEFYPWKLEKISDKKSVDIILKNKPFKTEYVDKYPIAYFSVNAKDLKIKDFYVHVEYLKKFDYATKTLINNYTEFHDIKKEGLSKESPHIEKFILDKKPDYGYLYRHPQTNEIKKFLIGYSFATDAHYIKYNELNLYELIKQSFTIAENVTKR